MKNGTPHIAIYLTTENNILYTYHPKNTCVPNDIAASSFIAGFVELYNISKQYPELRMIPISTVEVVRHQLKQLGFRPRIRYRGPHKYQRDTLKKDAWAYSVYLGDDSGN